MEREIMMDQIRMGDIDDMKHYKQYNLRVENVNDLNIDDENEHLKEISSDESDQNKDKEDDE